MSTLNDIVRGPSREGSIRTLCTRDTSYVRKKWGTMSAESCAIWMLLDGEEASSSFESCIQVRALTAIHWRGLTSKVSSHSQCKCFRSLCDWMGQYRIKHFTQFQVYVMVRCPIHCKSSLLWHFGSVWWTLPIDIDYSLNQTLHWKLVIDLTEAQRD